MFHRDGKFAIQNAFGQAPREGRDGLLAIGFDKLLQRREQGGMGKAFAFDACQNRLGEGLRHKGQSRAALVFGAGEFELEWRGKGHVGNDLSGRKGPAREVS